MVYLVNGVFMRKINLLAILSLGFVSSYAEQKKSNTEKRYEDRKAYVDTLQITGNGLKLCLENRYYSSQSCNDEIMHVDDNLNRYNYGLRKDALKHVYEMQACSDDNAIRTECTLIREMLALLENSYRAIS